MLNLRAEGCYSSGTVRDPILLVLNSLLIRLRGQAAMQAEIIALRHQLTVLQRCQRPKRIRLNNIDRCLWIGLSRWWANWRSALIMVKPETVIGWHRQGFRWYWTWKVRHGKSGRPQVPKQIRDLIRTMSRDNPIWGAPRIHSELMKLDIKISEASIAKYMVRAPNHHRRRGGRSSRITFLNLRPSTSSPSTLFGSKSSSFLLSSPTIDDASCTSTSQLIQRRNGQRSRCSRPFRLIPRLDICCEIEIESMARSSAIKSR